ncbi:MAG: phosphoribosylanthranilate isomerase [Candidatus Neomarinimicrobiota bacterium]|nr:phosphoribosylanthranilate isomerase [Candidatus Neomarinimicrobiota bacterium]
MIPVKVCGITNMDDACFVADSGVAAIGFIFYEKSPRYIDPKLAFKIISNIKSNIAFVGVFVNESLKIVNSISKEVGLDFVQLHGDENPSYCDQVSYPVIKAFRLGHFFDPEILVDYDVHSFLFDTHDDNFYGGTGKAFNWSLISSLNVGCPIILSGGLNELNINDGIKTVMPNGVDINSGIEAQPGIKDHGKIQSLFDNIDESSDLVNPFIKVREREL